MKSKTLLLVVALGLVLAPTVALAESWTNVSLVDTNCSGKVAANPDAHTRECALKCASSGFGILAADGKYLKFDAEGSKQAQGLLERSDRKDHLRVNLTGALAGETITVQAIELAPVAVAK